MLLSHEGDGAVDGRPTGGHLGDVRIAVLGAPRSSRGAEPLASRDHGTLEALGARLFETVGVEALAVVMWGCSLVSGGVTAGTGTGLSPAQTPGWNAADSSRVNTGPGAAR